MATPAWLDFKLSIGNIIVILTLVFGFGSTFNNIGRTQESIQKELTNLSNQVTNISKEYQRRDVAEASHNYYDKMLNELKTRLARIEAKIDRGR